MVNAPKDDSINKGKKVESENHQNETSSMSEEEIKNQEKINEEISDEVESEKSKQKVEVDSLKWRLLKEKEENEWNLNIEKFFSMTPTEIYKTVSDAFEDSDSKIGYLKEVQNDLKEQHPEKYEELSESLNIAINVLGYEKQAEIHLRYKDFHHATERYEKALKLDPENEELKNRIIEKWEIEAEKDIEEGHYGVAARKYEKALKLDPENEGLKNKVINASVKYAEIQISKGDYGSGAWNYEKALKLDPENEELKNKAIENYEKEAEELKEIIQKKDFKMRSFYDCAYLFNSIASTFDKLYTFTEDPKYREEAVKNYKKSINEGLKESGVNIWPIRWRYDRALELGLEPDPAIDREIKRLEDRRHVLTWASKE